MYLSHRHCTAQLRHHLLVVQRLANLYYINIIYNDNDNDNNNNINSNNNNRQMCVSLSLWSAGTKVNGKWKTMSYRSYYENVRLAAKGFIKVTAYF